MRLVASLVLYTALALGANAADTAALATLKQGDMAKLALAEAPKELPEGVLRDMSDAEHSLSDKRGKYLLVNFWATWCAPCRKEMPSLERLQKELGSDTFEVVALSVDRGGIEATKKFLDQVKVTGLGVYVDDTMRTTSTLRAVGMPTTLLIDKQGREVGRLIGPAEWDSADAKRLVEAELK